MLETGGFAASAAEIVYVAAAQALTSGRLDEAEAFLMRQAENGKRAGLSFYEENAASKLAGIQLFRGGSAIYGSEAIEGGWLHAIYRSYERLMHTGDPAPLPDPGLAGGSPWQVATVLLYRAEFRALAGDLDGAAHEIHEFDAMFAAVEPFSHAFTELGRRYMGVRWLGESATSSQSAAVIRRHSSHKLFWALVVPRLRGELALAAGDLELAESSLMDGLDWCIRERCPVEEGRVRQALAELAEKRSDHAAAVEQLDRAGELFQQFGAKLFLDQVLAKKEILKA
ncbi:hypothetical protein J0H33_06835 [bacterium]|nr:hypothetical protein [bacterium]